MCTNKADIPFQIADSERIARLLLCPQHVNRSGSLKAAAFKPPPDSNEISVNRFEYSNENECKRQGLKLASGSSIASSQKPKFQGIALFLAQIVSDMPDCELQYAPSRDNPAHANILYPFKTERGVPLTENQKKIVSIIVEACNLYLDESENPLWAGEIIPTSLR